jgi:hypothetical protein
MAERADPSVAAWVEQYLGWKAARRERALRQLAETSSSRRRAAYPAGTGPDVYAEIYVTVAGFWLWQLPREHRDPAWMRHAAAAGAERVSNARLLPGHRGEARPRTGAPGARPARPA